MAMNDLDITRLRVYLVAPDVTPPYRWTGTCKPSPVYYNIVRLTTACGIEGASGVLSGDYYEEQDQYDDPKISGVRENIWGQSEVPE